MNSSSLELLQRGAEELGLDVTAQFPAFERLFELLQEGNSRMNLTALKTEEDIVLKHFVDSLTCLRGGYLEGGLSVVDLGTGAGFPTFPLALARPELVFIPVDSTRKKIDFVRETAAQLGLQERVMPVVGRAEALGHLSEHRERYDRVVVRAVASLPVLAELALPLLREGGLLVAQKGDISADELNAGRRAAGEVGGKVQVVDPFGLPILGDARTLVIIEKLKPTSPKYPRREGVPTAQPLFWESQPKQSR
ncbi:16S rRNA (guanine(527)-N(7))-methyltransferase RsmG [Deinococcus arenicola]|uniref:Ribosomal RNA small subunit methyltransferase G n=1 Tax=Deinococcus arenicola TaxID=2994950 RepID=A0ABU4DL96_9DEIO|nr:16S rRNA (guanine(527)-N(7))-methyltransferase RsmG [Deinococcus sp. ZS9-10]MDV6373202.1 16S rRNA (guanine(527)-N(7))-methyltransferase RsmG [Deinococcus sp. ZS9-10]